MKRSTELLFIILFLIAIIGCSNEVNTSVSLNEPTTDKIENVPKEDLPNVIEHTYKSNVQEFELTQEDINKIKNNRTGYPTQVVFDALDKLKPRLVKEFRESIYNLENQYSIENLVMASIKIKPIKVLNIQKDDGKFLLDKVNLVKDPRLLKSPIYSNITIDGIEFIAIVQPITNESNDFANIVNKIRNSEEEMNLMSEMKEKTNLFTVDIYVEDLLDASDEINLSSILLDNKYSFIQSPTVSTLNILEKYNRTFSNSLKLKNKTWNLFLFQQIDSLPKEITLRYNDFQNLQLVQQYYAFRAE